MSHNPTSTRRAKAAAMPLRRVLSALRPIAPAHLRTHRLLLALGYAIKLTPNRMPAFTRELVWKGHAVSVWIMNDTRTDLPRSLSAPAWIGYYGVGDAPEMLHDEDIPRLLDFLRDAHPEQFHPVTAGAEH